MKMFSCRIQATQLETAMDLPGWSHAGPETQDKVLWYPWVEAFRRIYFFAKHRTQAAKQLDRLNILARDLDGGRRCDAMLPAKFASGL